MLTYEKLKKYQNIYNYLICLILAFTILLFCSSNSFLCNFNDWCDLNWFLTMGNGVLNGKIPFKDLYEQKGPITYFVFSIFALFNNSYHAVFVFEVILFSIFLFLVFNFSKQHLNTYLCWVCIIILAVFTPTSEFFIAGGGALEEYFIPIYFYFIIILHNIAHNKQIKKHSSFLFGIFSAVIFWTKYTCIVFPALTIITWFIINIIRRQYKAAFNSLLYMFYGVLTITIPILLYFIFNNAIKDLFMCYFYDNLVRYSGSFGYMPMSFFKNTFFFTLVFGCTISIIKNKKTNTIVTIPIILTVLFMMFQRTRTYYWLICFAFFAFALIFIISLFNKIKLKTWVCAEIIAITFITSFSYCIYESNSRSEIGRNNQEYIQIQIANYIKESNIENPTLFCYLLLDYGFYNAANITPHVKYYARNNFGESAYPEMYQSFEDTLTSASSDFVIITKYDYNNKKDILEPNYELVNTYKYLYHEVTNSTYYIEVYLLQRTI